jgi:hypothetical protein
MRGDSYLPSSPATLQALDRMEYTMTNSNCAEIIRHRRQCDLPRATGGGTVEGCIASNVVCFRDFVVGCVLSTTSHGVKTRAGGDEGATVAGTVPWWRRGLTRRK